MPKKIYFDDLIRKGEDIKALRYLAKELYNGKMIGGTRKSLLDRVADEYEKLEENEAYASLRAIELIKENEKLKQEVIRCFEENEKLKDENNGISHGYLEHIEALQNLHQQEIENLIYKVQYLTDCGIEKEEKYKEALRKCSPLEPRVLAKETGVWAYCCKFCRQIQASDTREFHTDDCEYVRLCGTDINVGIKKEA